MTEDDKWLNEIKDKLDGFEESVPDGLWEDIEMSMSEGKKRLSPVFLPWLWRGSVAAAAVALGVFAGMRLLDSPDSPVDGQVSVVANVSEDSSPDVAAEEGMSLEGRTAESLLAEAEPSARVKNQGERRTSSISDDAVSDVPESFQGGSEETSSVEPEREAVESPAVEPLSEETASPDKKREAEESYEYDSLDKYLSETSQNDKSAGNSPIAVNMSFSGATTSTSDVRSFNPMMFYRGSDPAFDHSGFSGNGIITGNNLQTRSMSPALLTSSSNITTVVDHERPVRMQLTVHKSFGGFLGVESGLSCSTLRSTFTTDSGNTLKKETQTLRYLGVPLNLTASAFRSERFSIYFSGGGMAEKCVSGKVRITETVSGERQGTAQSVDLTVKPLLLSLNASAGVQVNLSGMFGLYAEPGVSYHFDDGSSVETIYKDRPFDFVMTFGARFSFR